jgi:hypothetical protein
MDLERIRLLLQRPRRLRQVIGVVGQPRSGTTLLAAMLGMHSRINAVFEPWNLKHAQTGNGCRITLDDFIISLDVKFSAQQDVLLLKETTTELAYVNGLASLLSSLTGPVRPGLIVIIRNPFHVYLSEIEARRKWWGANGLTISSETFDRWASRTLDALGALRSLAERFDGVVITYEKLTRSPKSVGKLLGFFGLSLTCRPLGGGRGSGPFEEPAARIRFVGGPAYPGIRRDTGDNQRFPVLRRDGRACQMDRRAA